MRTMMTSGRCWPLARRRGLWSWGENEECKGLGSIPNLSLLPNQGGAGVSLQGFEGMLDALPSKLDKLDAVGRCESMFPLEACTFAQAQGTLIECRHSSPEPHRSLA